MDITFDGSHHLYGLAEHAVREVKAKTRTLKLQAEESRNTKIGNDHVCLPFMVMEAAMTINVGRRGPARPGLARKMAS